MFIEHVSNSMLFDIQKDRLNNTLLNVVNHNFISEIAKDEIKKYLSKQNPNYVDFNSIISTSTKNILFKNNVNKENIISTVRKNPAKLIISAGTSKKDLTYRIYEEDLEKKYFNSLINSIISNLQIDLKNCFFINAYPAGIQLPPNVNGIDVGARVELIDKIYNEFKDSYQDLILICTPDLLKVLTFRFKFKPDEINRFKVILGGSWYPQSMIEAISKIWGITNNTFIKNTLSFYGISEVGLNIGIQNTELIEQLNENELSNKMLFEINPELYFYESINNELVITSYFQNRYFPIIRYLTGDHVKLFKINNKIVFTHESRINKYKIKEIDIYDTIYKNYHVLNFISGRFKINNHNIIFELNPNIKLDTFNQNQIKTLFDKEINCKFVESLDESLFKDDLLRKWACYE